MKKLTIVFIHGGPGLNSNPESCLLSQVFKDSNLDIVFWNEPRVLTSNNLFDEITQDLIEFINSQQSDVIALTHSFGARYLISSLDSIKEKLKGALLLAPVIDTMNADNNIIKKAQQMFKSSNSELSSEFEKLLLNLTDEFDENKAIATTMAFSSGYLAENFTDSANFEKYFSYFQDENEFNLERYMNVKRSFNLKNESSHRSQVPCLAIFGRSDPIFDFKYESKQLLKHFPKARSICFDNVAHYPHIDATEKFLSELTSFMDNIS